MKIELSVRTFHRTDDGVDVAPRIATVVDLSKVEDWAALIEHFVSIAEASVRKLPFTVRPMTDDEITEYRAEDRE